MARIEEQQKAIHNLKSNLMDDLNDKGILSDPQCQKVIEIHQQEQEKLATKLESQRAKQQKVRISHFLFFNWWVVHILIVNFAVLSHV